MAALKVEKIHSVLYSMLTQQSCSKVHLVADVDLFNCITPSSPADTDCPVCIDVQISILTRILVHVGLKLEIESSFLTLETAVDKTTSPRAPFSRVFLKGEEEKLYSMFWKMVSGTAN